MHSDTQRYIAGCYLCQVHNPRCAIAPGQMITRPPNKQVFSRVAIDYIEKKPRTALGNRYALMIIDQTSRYTTADSSPTATAE